MLLNALAIWPESGHDNVKWGYNSGLIYQGVITELSFGISKNLFTYRYQIIKLFLEAVPLSHYDLIKTEIIRCQWIAFVTRKGGTGQKPLSYFRLHVNDGEHLEYSWFVNNFTKFSHGGQTEIAISAIPELSQSRLTHHQNLQGWYLW